MLMLIIFCIQKVARLLPSDRTQSLALALTALDLALNNLKIRSPYFRLAFPADKSTPEKALL